ncbi:MAG: recombinase RecT [Clostridiales Family XIII bacterium]|jgi:phage recombination protein Bet|nr:recombinase RecT [Clostridiales Family XIII bacterium]
MNELKIINKNSAATIINWEDPAVLKTLGIQANTPVDQIILFKELCEGKGLNPLKREAFLVPYGRNSYQTIVGINGYIQIAQQSGNFKGIESLYVDYDQNVTKFWTKYDRSLAEWRKYGSSPTAAINTLIKEGKLPAAAETTVYTHDGGCFTDSVLMVERNKCVGEWLNQPTHMLKKCAMAATLRIAFTELSGTYIPEEMPSDFKGPVKEKPMESVSVIKELEKEIEGSKPLSEKRFNDAISYFQKKGMEEKLLLKIKEQGTLTEDQAKEIMKRLR